MNLKEAIKAEAQRLGFQLVGVTTPDSPPHGDVFERWLQAGRHGEMNYLATELSIQRRLNPRLTLPECRSILVLGTLYPPSAPGQQVAAYAVGLDYHEVLPPRLRTLAEFIEAQLGRPVTNRWYTDTGPLLERDLAQRAGLGWIGKNTCLINPQAGSYFFLSEILLDVALEADLPFTADHCGQCARCIQACPTGCILPDRTIDARRCIAYLNIELKGSIPPDLRPLMNGWVFGCDTCQQVCPWNQRFAPTVNAPDFRARQVSVSLDLNQELSLTPEDFNRKFRHSPIRRAKRRGYLRNVAIALGNSQADLAAQELAVVALERVLLVEGEPLVRGHAAWALGQVESEAARAALEQAASTECDDSVQAEITAARHGSARPVL